MSLFLLICIIFFDKLYCLLSVSYTVSLSFMLHMTPMVKQIMIFGYGFLIFFIIKFITLYTTFMIANYSVAHGFL